MLISGSAPKIMLSSGRILKAMVWDLDGTLIDSFIMGLKNLEALMKVHGFVTTPEITKRMLEAWGKSGSEVIAEGYGVDLYFAERVSNEWDSLSDSNPNQKFPLIRGAAKMVKFCHESGIENTLLTSRGQPHGNTILLQHDLARYFSFIVECGNSIYKKPHPKVLDLTLSYLKRSKNIDREECLLVGDTITDIRSAKNTGLSEGILVRTGPPQVLPEGFLSDKNILKSVADLEVWFKQRTSK
jgi:phosphoglycolate phosphatase-like HAD superfamily hydrolase